MSLAHHALILLAFALVAFAGAYWQAEAAPRDSSEGRAARFVCPLH